MDLAQGLLDAGITRIAVVDDDLSKSIAMNDLSAIDAEIADKLNDRNDADNQAYRALLRELHLSLDGDIAEHLSDPAVREHAPEYLRNLAERVLQDREGSAAPVLRVKNLLITAGISADNIDEYTGPEIAHDKFYDLLIVDYLLVGTSAEKTLPFIKQVHESHAEREQPLQIILMSTHENRLKAVFDEVRPELNVSSSRMRIMHKPMTDDELLQWMLVLHQLAVERAFVPAIEDFIRKSGQAIEKAAVQEAKRLWGLDLQAMDLLHETIHADHDNYSRYVEEAISRDLLTRLESEQDMRRSIDRLGTLLEPHRATKTISPSAEIGDSQALIRGLMTSTEWRGGQPTFSVPYPAQETPHAKAKWVRGNLRFGMVLRDPQGVDWLHLTQACDLAQAVDEELASSCILLVRGFRSLPTPSSSTAKQALVGMSALMTDGDTHVLGWDLRQVRTPTIEAFAVEYGNGWSVQGEMRLDRAQNIVAQYGSRAARVGLTKTLRSWQLSGVALLAGVLMDAEEGADVAGEGVVGHAMYRNQSHELHIEHASLQMLLGEFPGTHTDASLSLYAGKRVNLGKSDIGPPFLMYCETKPTSMGALRTQVSKANSQFLTKPANRDKLIVALWAKQ